MTETPLRVLSTGLDSYESALLELERLGLVKLIYQDDTPRKGDVFFYDFAAKDLLSISPFVGVHQYQGIRCVAATRWWGTILSHEISQALSKFDLVVVPGAFSREVICKGDARVARVPYPIDVLEIEPSDHPTREKFTFYTIVDEGDALETNIMGTVLSFIHDFEGTEDVSLVVSAENSKWLKEAFRGYGDYIKVVDNNPSTTESLHLDCDCYVSTRRGGFDPYAIQAAWMQRPVLATNYGDLRDYLPSGADIGYQLTPRPDNARYLWAEPDLWHLSRRMRDMFELWGSDRDYSSLVRNRQAMDDRFSAPVVAQQLYRVLKGW